MGPLRVFYGPFGKPLQLRSWFMKLSKYSWITQSPGGITRQWGSGRDL